jgi:hypothetical protein
LELQGRLELAAVASVPKVLHADGQGDFLLEEKGRSGNWDARRSELRRVVGAGELQALAVQTDTHFLRPLAEVKLDFRLAMLEGEFDRVFVDIGGRVVVVPAAASHLLEIEGGERLERRLAVVFDIPGPRDEFQLAGIRRERERDGFGAKLGRCQVASANGS